MLILLDIFILTFAFLFNIDNPFEFQLIMLPSVQEQHAVPSVMQGMSELHTNVLVPLMAI